MKLEDRLGKFMMANPEWINIHICLCKIQFKIVAKLKLLWKKIQSCYILQKKEKWHWCQFQLCHINADCFARNASIMFITLPTFKWILNARIDKQLTQLILYLQWFFYLNDTLKINPHMNLAHWYDYGLIKCIETQ